MWQLPMMPWGTNKPWHVTDAGFWSLALAILWTLFLFSSGGHNYVHDFQKQFEMWTLQATAHSSNLHQSISDEVRPQENLAAFLDDVDIWLSLCTFHFLDAATNCVYWQRFSIVFLSPCSILYILCGFLMQRCLRDFSGSLESFNDLLDCRCRNR